MRSQLHAAVSPSPLRSLLRALRSVTPRALRFHSVRPLVFLPIYLFRLPGAWIHEEEYFRSDKEEHMNVERRISATFSRSGAFLRFVVALFS